MIFATNQGAIPSNSREETAMNLLAERALLTNITLLLRDVFEVLKGRGFA